MVTDAQGGFATAFFPVLSIAPSQKNSVSSVLSPSQPASKNPFLDEMARILLLHIRVPVD
jgi:hypothetical protein